MPRVSEGRVMRVCQNGVLDLYEHARREYERCMKVPNVSEERHYIRHYMAFLRDFIAVMEGSDSEVVQTEFEQRYAE